MFQRAQHSYYRMPPKMSDRAFNFHCNIKRKSACVVADIKITPNSLNRLGISDHLQIRSNLGMLSKQTQNLGVPTTASFAADKWNWNSKHFKKLKLTYEKIVNATIFAERPVHMLKVKMRRVYFKILERLGQMGKSSRVCVVHG